jgi:hypothetical protein
MNSEIMHSEKTMPFSFILNYPKLNIFYLYQT